MSNNNNHLGMYQPCQFFSGSSHHPMPCPSLFLRCSPFMKVTSLLLSQDLFPLVTWRKFFIKSTLLKNSLIPCRIVFYIVECRRRKGPCVHRALEKPGMFHAQGPRINGEIKHLLSAQKAGDDVF